jgi:hypothetical protein
MMFDQAIKIRLSFGPDGQIKDDFIAFCKIILYIYIQENLK